MVRSGTAVDGYLAGGSGVRPVAPATHASIPAVPPVKPFYIISTLFRNEELILWFFYA
jgi:hypothetical protein